MSDDDFVPKKKKETPKKSAKREPVAKKEPATKKKPAAKKPPAKKNNGTADNILLPNDVVADVNNDDVPMTKLLPKRATAHNKPMIDISDEDDIPVAKSDKKPRAAASKPKRKYSSSDSDDFKSPSTSSMLI